jgi:hypothetical protein
MDHPPPLPPARIVREKRTVAAMIELYCQSHHGGGAGLCGPCDRLLEYAFCRLDRCPFREEKTPCARCPVHCYGPTMRARIQEVMRYAGPRMLFRHPVMALRHQWDSLRKPKGIDE